MKRGWFVFLFAFSMAYLESAVVYYLREICCPSGFSFPLPPPTIDIYLIELGRELATLLMILSVSFILGKGIRRLAYFSIIFGIWDIFYYFWLYVFLKWPSSILEWDILFSIPVSWASPVICPIIVAFLLITIGIFVLKITERRGKIEVSVVEKSMFVLSQILLFLSFTIDAFKNPKIYLEIKPEKFHWGIYLTGLLFLMISSLLALKRNRIPSK